MSRKTISHLLSAALGFVFTLSACGQIKALVFPQPTVEPGTVLFEDDFSNPPNGWGTAARDGGKISFIYDGMMFSVVEPNSMHLSVNKKELSDSRIEVDAILAAGSTNDNFGIICRYQDEKNYYGFLYSHDGYYGIFKLVNGVMVMGSEDGNLGFSEKIRQGGAGNRLQATCEGDVFTLSVNDSVLAMVKDDAFKSGKFGLFAGTYDAPGSVVFFDNFIVKQP